MVDLGSDEHGPSGARPARVEAAVEPENNQIPGLLSMVEEIMGDAENANVTVLEAELQQTHLEQEETAGGGGVAAPKVIPVPVANNERVRTEKRATQREAKAALPGKLDWKKEVRPDWGSRFPWHAIREDKATGRAKIACNLCEKYKKDTAFARGGSINFKTNGLLDHAGSQEHIEAVYEEGSSGLMKGVVKEAVTLEHQTAINLFRAAYWVAKEDVALLKYGSLLDLLKDCRTKVPSELYHNNKAALQFVDACAQVIFEKQKQEIRASPVVSIGIDESSDIAADEHLIIYCKYIGPAKKVSLSASATWVF